MSLLRCWSFEEIVEVSEDMPTLAAVSTPGGSGKEVEHGSPRPSSPFAALGLRRTRFSSVPLVEIKQNADTEEITFPASVELPRRHVTFYSDVDSDSSLSGVS
ncbi:uncharacterized protein TNCV_2961431 [Trichonephila clavipes]|nr:uncharacterized protein TNCV_2961431 [Trichonephila clavipes]